MELDGGFEERWFTLDQRAANVARLSVPQLVECHPAYKAICRELRSSELGRHFSIRHDRTQGVNHL